MAKPMITAKNALIRPVALFFGVSMAAYLPHFTGCPCFARTRCFLAQNASFPVT